MAFASPEMRTFAQRVCTLYKKSMRHIESYYSDRALTRYHQVQLRARFDCNAKVCDPMERRRLLFVGENEFFEKQHPSPGAKFAYSVGVAGGVAYAREVEPPDWVLDYWHPLEKAQYPEYFLRRECRKWQYCDLWSRGWLC